MRILFIFLFLGMVSCKSEVGKLDINDVESHRAYQDTLISNAEFPNGKLDAIRNLISQYTNLKDNKEYSNNSNYNYYLGRLYSYMYSLPIYGLFYDSTSSRLLNYNLYKNFVDSAYYYSEKSLSIDSNNILSMLAYTRSLFWERENYLFFKEKGLETKYGGNDDPQKMKKRVEYLLNNFSKFSSLDTAKDKRVSRKIYEMSFSFLYPTIDNKIKSDINWSDENDLQLLSFTGNCINFLKKHKLTEIDQGYFNKVSNYLMAFVDKANDKIRANEKIKQEQIDAVKRKEALINIDIRHKYSFVDNYSGVSAQLDLWTNSDYTQVVSVGVRGRGIYKRNGDILHLTSTSGISITGDVKIELDKNYNIILTVIGTGARYRQDDNGYYIKNNISTSR